MAEIPEPKTIPIAKLTPHPRNYRKHPQDQLDHIKISIEEHGFYKNIVISSDDFILGGHGAVEAAGQLGLKKVPAVRMPFDHLDTRALKILASDNYLAHFAEDDDRMLTELLREVDDLDSLLGTGFDEMMLVAYEEVIRPPDMLNEFDPTDEWESAGMPDFEVQEDSLRLVIHFEDPDERQRVVDDLSLYVTNREGKVWSAPYPPVEGRADRSSVMIEG